MELMVSRRLWMVLIAAFALSLVLATLFAPWTNLLVQPTPPVHINSPVASDNQRDLSYLTDETREDGTIWACDYSENQKKSAGRAFNNGFVARTVHDENGAGGDVPMTSWVRTRVGTTPATGTILSRAADQTASTAPRMRHARGPSRHASQHLRRVL